MENTLENSKCLASLAVFRELYDNQKDVYGVISEFLKEIISSENKYQFGLTEITLLLNESYDFKIPEAVVKTSLSRLPFLSKSNGVYSVNKPIDQIRNKEFQEKQNKIYNSNNNVVNRLFIYIESQKKVTLSEAEKEIIVKSLCSFMLDESTVQEYSEYIGAFIVQCKSEDTLLAQLDTIKDDIRWKQKSQKELEDAIQNLRREFANKQVEEQEKLKELIQHKKYFDFLSGRDLSTYNVNDETQYLDLRINDEEVKYENYSSFRNQVLDIFARNNRKIEAHFLDNLLISVHQNTLTLLAGLPGTGKTSLAKLLVNTLAS